MPISSINTDTTVEKLITRVYGKLPAAKLRSIKAATFAANPHLNDVEHLPAGTVVFVPPLDANTTVPGRADMRVAGDTLKDIASAIAGYRDDIARAAVQRLSELDDAEKILSTPQFRRDADAVKEGAGTIAQLADAIKEERSTVAATRGAMAKDAQALADALLKLGDRVG